MPRRCLRTQYRPSSRSGWTLEKLQSVAPRARVPAVVGGSTRRVIGETLRGRGGGLDDCLGPVLIDMDAPTVVKACCGQEEAR